MLLADFLVDIYPKIIIAIFGLLLLAIVIPVVVFVFGVTAGSFLRAFAAVSNALRPLGRLSAPVAIVSFSLTPAFILAAAVWNIPFTSHLAVLGAVPWVYWIDCGAQHLDEQGRRDANRARSRYVINPVGGFVLLYWGIGVIACVVHAIRSIW